MSTDRLHTTAETAPVLFVFALAVLGFLFVTLLAQQVGIVWPWSAALGVVAVAVVAAIYRLRVD